MAASEPVPSWEEGEEGPSEARALEPGRANEASSMHGVTNELKAYLDQQLPSLVERTLAKQLLQLQQEVRAVLLATSALSSVNWQACLVYF